MISALLAEVDEAGPVPEASPEGFAETVGLLVDLADDAGLERPEVGAMILQQALARLVAQRDANVALGRLGAP